MLEKFETKKSLGQHFLNSSAVPGWLCDAADIQKGDIVLEIGPGTGALTQELLLREAKVIALEADERAVTTLENNYPKEIDLGNLEIHHHDVRELDLSTLGLKDHQFKVVSNIPYYLTGMLFRVLLESTIQPNTLVFLIQKEVAKRITTDLSRNEKESLLSLSVKAYGEPKYIKTVSRGHFTPPPKVDSAIIAVTNIKRDRFKDLDEKFFFELLHFGFGQKRKQLQSNLVKANLPHINREVLEQAFTELNLSQSIRAEDLDIEDWTRLAKIIAEQNKG